MFFQYLKAKKVISVMKEEKGQFVIEYVLLLLVSVAIATVLITLIKLPNGPVIGWWKKVLVFIGNDLST